MKVRRWHHLTVLFIGFMLASCNLDTGTDQRRSHTRDAKSIAAETAKTMSNLNRNEYVVEGRQESERPDLAEVNLQVRHIGGYGKAYDLKVYSSHRFFEAFQDLNVGDTTRFHYVGGTDGRRNEISTYLAPITPRVTEVVNRERGSY